MLHWSWEQQGPAHTLQHYILKARNLVLEINLDALERSNLHLGS
jgi:hypothetical protein